MSRGKPAGASASYPKRDSVMERKRQREELGQLVGCRVKCFWPIENQYFLGTLKRSSKSTAPGAYKVVYDDGDWEEITLPDDSVVLLGDAADTTGAPTAKKHAKPKAGAESKPTAKVLASGAAAAASEASPPPARHHRKEDLRSPTAPSPLVGWSTDVKQRRTARRRSGSAEKAAAGAADAEEAVAEVAKPAKSKSRVTAPGPETAEKLSSQRNLLGHDNDPASCLCSGSTSTTLFVSSPTASAATTSTVEINSHSHGQDGNKPNGSGHCKFAQVDPTAGAVDGEDAAMLEEGEEDADDETKAEAEAEAELTGEELAVQWAALHVGEAHAAVVAKAMREEGICMDTLALMSEEELLTELRLDAFLPARRLAVAVAALRQARDAAAAGATPPPAPPPPPKVAAWLRAGLPGDLGEAAAQVALDQRIDGAMLCTLRSRQEVACAFACGGGGGVDGTALAADDRLVHAVHALLEPLARMAAAAPLGFVAPLPPHVALAPTVVVVLGDTGAGKSTTLNALMGERTLLPTNGMRACTAAIVELSYLPPPMPAPAAAADVRAHAYEGVVEFVSKAEWSAELAAMYAALPAAGVGAAPPAEGTPAHEAWCKLRSVYGRVLGRDELAAADAGTLAPSPGGAGAPPATVEEVATWMATKCADDRLAQVVRDEQVDGEILASMDKDDLAGVFFPDTADGGGDACAALAHAIITSWGDAAARTATTAAAQRVQEVLGKRLVIKADSAEALHAQVETYVDSTNNTAAGALWPLVRRVQLKGPWEALSTGAVVVDAPGVQDDNSARDNVVKGYLKAAESVWLVSNCRRAVNDKTTKDMLLPSFRQALARHGRVGMLAFVATQTDVLVRSEIADNLGLKEDASMVECARARNAYTKQRLLKDFTMGLELEPHHALSHQIHANAVHTNLLVPHEALAPAAPAAHKHWGRYEPVEVRPGTHVMRWTDDGSALRDMDCSVPLLEGETEPCKDGFQFPVFCVSAVDFQKLAGIRTTDGPPKAFTELADTEVPALRQFVHRTVEAHVAAQQRNTRVMGTLTATLSALDEKMTALEYAMVNNPRCQATRKQFEALEATHIRLGDDLEALKKMHAAQIKAGLAMLECREESQAAARREDAEMEGEEEEGQAQGEGEAPTTLEARFMLGPVGYFLPHPEWTCSHVIGVRNIASAAALNLGGFWTALHRGDPFGVIARWLLDRDSGPSRSFTTEFHDKANCVRDALAALPATHGKVSFTLAQKRLWGRQRGYYVGHEMQLTKISQGTRDLSGICGQWCVGGEARCPACDAPRPSAPPAAGESVAPTTPVVAIAAASASAPIAAAALVDSMAASSPAPAAAVPMPPATPPAASLTFAALAAAQLRDAQLTGERRTRGGRGWEGQGERKVTHSTKEQKRWSMIPQARAEVESTSAPVSPPPRPNVAPAVEVDSVAALAVPTTEAAAPDHNEHPALTPAVAPAITAATTAATIAVTTPSAAAIAEQQRWCSLLDWEPEDSDDDDDSGRDAPLGQLFTQSAAQLAAAAERVPSPLSDSEDND